MNRQYLSMFSNLEHVIYWYENKERKVLKTHKISRHTIAAGSSFAGSGPVF